jgi:DNA-binding response OmpR family regulator
LPAVREGEEGPMPHVLLIDDDEDLVASNKAFLEARGFKVSVAYSGNEGWSVLQAIHPDIVVLDCMMEDFTSGFELAQDISAKYPTLPTIMLTSVHAHLSSEWHFGPRDQGWLPVNRFMEKPVPPARLVAEIEQLLAPKDGA